MIKVGTVTGREITTNIDGTQLAMMLQVEITSPEDIQTVEVIGRAGENSNPPDGSTVVIVKIGNAWKIAVAVDDGIAPDASLTPGEKKVYSSDGGVIKSFITWLKTKLVLSGEVIEINGNTDFAVRYIALEAAFTALKAEIDAHVHSGVTSGLSNTGIPTVPLATVLTPAKVTTVKLP